MNSELNFVLELVDGTVLITAFSAAVFILIYIVDDYRDSKRQLLEYLYDPPKPIRLAFPLFFVRIGAVLLVGALLSSRFRDEQETTLELALIMLGIVILVIALMWTMRVLTHIRYGEWPWAATAAVTLLYIVSMMLWHHFSII